jgi:hypothetical protein
MNVVRSRAVVGLIRLPIHSKAFLLIPGSKDALVVLSDSFSISGTFSEMFTDSTKITLYTRHQNALIGIGSP